MSNQPTGEDLQAFLTAARAISDPPNAAQQLLGYQAAVDAAFETFTERVRWEPFLSSGADETRKFDPPDSDLLDLGAGLLSCTSVAVNGTAYVQDTDFFLGPTNAPARKRPYTFIEFSRSLLAVGYAPHLSGPRRSIVIVGTWGRVAALSEDDTQAVLAGAAHLLYPQLASAVSEGRMKWTEGDVSEEYARAADSGPFSTEAKAWKAQYEERIAFRMMRRIV